MKVNTDIMATMMDVLRAELAVDPTIMVFREGETDICTLTFKDLQPLEIGEKAALKFIAPDDSYILRAAATADGVVDNFIIFGTGSDIAITGTVGSLVSSADIKFSRTNWVSGTVITIQNLVLSLIQGS